MKVLSPPGTDWYTVKDNRTKISMVDDYSLDGGRSFLGLETPSSIDSSRVLIRYA